MISAKLVAALCVLPLSACIAVGPDYVRPAPLAVQSYKAPGDLALPQSQRLVFGRDHSLTWWEEFRSPALDTVVARAIADNPSIDAARARVAAAQESVAAAEGALLPQIGLGATVGRQKYGPPMFGPIDIQVPTYSYYSVGPSASLALDVFGGERRRIEESAAFTEYQFYKLQSAYLFLVANVVTQAFTIAAAKAQIATYRRIIAGDERDLALVRTAQKTGTGTQTQVLSVESQLASDETSLPGLERQKSVAEHALTILIGEAPANWTPPDFNLSDFTLPRQIPASLPSELTHQRPDIRAAEAQLHAASAAIGVATADLYPKINLTSMIAEQALLPAGPYGAATAAWSAAAGLTQPLFDGGQLEAKRRAAIDAYRAALADYRQILLTSFGQVGDALQALATDGEQFQAESVALHTAVSAHDLAQESYATGNSRILDVLDAERHASEAAIGITQARMRRLLDTAALFEALGGTPLAGPEARAKPEDISMKQ
ncbi:MAG: efflux transporter outer membrane subunit [Methylovirgula sp.]